MGGSLRRTVRRQGRRRGERQGWLSVRVRRSKPPPPPGFSLTARTKCLSNVDQRNQPTAIEAASTPVISAANERGEAISAATIDRCRGAAGRGGERADLEHDHGEAIGRDDRPRRAERRPEGCRVPCRSRRSSRRMAYTAERIRDRRTRRGSWRTAAASAESSYSATFCCCACAAVSPRSPRSSPSGSATRFASAPRFVGTLAAAACIVPGEIERLVSACVTPSRFSYSAFNVPTTTSFANTPVKMPTVAGQLSCRDAHRPEARRQRAADRRQHRLVGVLVADAAVGADRADEVQHDDDRDDRFAGAQHESLEALPRVHEQAAQRRHVIGRQLHHERRRRTRQQIAAHDQRRHRPQRRCRADTARTRGSDRCWERTRPRTTHTRSAARRTTCTAPSMS